MDSTRTNNLNKPCIWSKVDEKLQDPSNYEQIMVIVDPQELSDEMIEIKDENTIKMF